MDELWWTMYGAVRDQDSVCLANAQFTKQFLNITGWWFGCHFLFSHILGMSSSQLTFIFFRGVQTTNQININIKHDVEHLVENDSGLLEQWLSSWWWFGMNPVNIDPEQPTMAGL